MANVAFTVAAAATLTAAGAANASIFSFASDTDHETFTFFGNGATISDTGRLDPVELLIDDENGSQLPLTYEVNFDANFTIDFVQSVDLGGGLYIHTYALDGTFGFFDDNGGAVLTASIDNGALTAMGTQSSWLSTSTVLSADGDNSDVTYTWSGGDMPDYGLFDGDSIGIDDAAFTLTFLQEVSGASGVALGSDLLPANNWQSEGSFSGSAQFIPAPASATLMVIGGLVGLRRRRD